jgi:regulator of RNase E activity RraB
MNWLNIICKEHNIIIFDLIELTSIPKTTLYRIDNHYINDLKLNELGKIAVALGMTPKEFVARYYDRFIKKVG